MDIAVAVRLDRGDGSGDATFILFCREKVVNSRWCWRYVVCEDGWEGSDFGSLEEFLEWLAGYGEQTESDLEQHCVDLSGRGMVIGGGPEVYVDWRTQLAWPG